MKNLIQKNFFATCIIEFLESNDIIEDLEYEDLLMVERCDTFGKQTISQLMSGAVILSRVRVCVSVFIVTTEWRRFHGNCASRRPPTITEL